MHDIKAWLLGGGGAPAFLLSSALGGTDLSDLCPGHFSPIERPAYNIRTYLECGREGAGWFMTALLPSFEGDADMVVLTFFLCFSSSGSIDNYRAINRRPIQTVPFLNCKETSNKSVSSSTPVGPSLGNCLQAHVTSFGMCKATL